MGINSNDINVFRYCGEQYDRETGNIYLRARYYDPARGRFTQEDPAKSGTNWYVYCENNPIRYVDPSGLNPGDSFKTLEEAAIDAGNYYMAITIENDEEVCGVFYKNADGTFTYYDVENTSSDTTLGFYVGWDDAPVGFIHTHVFYDVNNPNNEFSTSDTTTGSEGDDISFSDENGIPIFLAAPTGELKKYDPSTKETSSVGDIIVDPKYTAYQQISNTLIWQLLDQQYPSINKMDIVKARVKHPDSLYDMLQELGIIK